MRQDSSRRGFAVALGRAGKIDQIVAIALAQKLDIEPLVDRIERPFAEFDRVQRYHATARIGYRQSRSARRIGIDRQRTVLPRQLDQPRADIAVDGNFGQPRPAARRDTLRGKPLGESERIRLREGGRAAGRRRQSDGEKR